MASFGKLLKNFHLIALALVLFLTTLSHAKTETSQTVKDSINTGLEYYEKQELLKAIKEFENVTKTLIEKYSALVETFLPGAPEGWTIPEIKSQNDTSKQFRQMKIALRSYKKTEREGEDSKTIGIEVRYTTSSRLFDVHKISEKFNSMTQDEDILSYKGHKVFRAYRSHQTKSDPSFTLFLHDNLFISINSDASSYKDYKMDFETAKLFLDKIDLEGLSDLSRK